MRGTLAQGARETEREQPAREDRARFERENEEAWNADVYGVHAHIKELRPNGFTNHPKWSNKIGEDHKRGFDTTDMDLEIGMS